MASGVSRKISAASARAHTRRTKKSSSTNLPSGLLKIALAGVFVGFLAWAYLAIQPPPPKICGSPDGAPITAPRIKLRDGRHLAYKEHGVPKDAAKYKIIYVHGFDNCRHDAVVANTLSPEVVENLGVYIVSFDRPGYGESDPDPNRTVKSLALDIEELADQLQLGSKFFVVGLSMGGQVIWSCLKYIPQRLEGAAILAPVVNYWWSGLPANLTSEAYKQQKLQDQWTLRVGHYFPWLTYWWNTQKWFPSSSVIAHSPDILSRQDQEIVTKRPDRKNYVAQVKQQGDYESIYRDIIIGFGNWEFSPLDLENPFPNNEGSVHLWHGDDDLLVPVKLQRYIAQKLPWIHYHELPGAGHLFPYADGMSDTIIKSLLHEK
ncbi:putative alpha/Beta hydrolase [Senna tora]|uniref:Putative alpha/Beta hydrolase n=1 Tax=Senna tora TaxID=362788 RepID=A0A834W3C8_9FABA|nr:putative alpha/Beta hydrolase [Senna tora]